MPNKQDWEKVRTAAKDGLNQALISIDVNQAVIELAERHIKNGK